MTVETMWNGSGSESEVGESQVQVIQSGDCACHPESSHLDHKPIAQDAKDKGGTLLAVPLGKDRSS